MQKENTQNTETLVDSVTRWFRRSTEHKGKTTCKQQKQPTDNHLILSTVKHEEGSRDYCHTFKNK